MHCHADGLWLCGDGCMARVYGRCRTHVFSRHKSGLSLIQSTDVDELEAARKWRTSQPRSEILRTQMRRGWSHSETSARTGAVSPWGGTTRLSTFLGLATFLYTSAASLPPDYPLLWPLSLLHHAQDPTPPQPLFSLFSTFEGMCDTTSRAIQHSADHAGGRTARTQRSD